uniref:Tyrosine-protein phosphatase domain-containing protein n=1 Tax=Pseudonaja textilis TaxID=8673 RepID=A0A670Z722_PSETE
WITSATWRKILGENMGKNIRTHFLGHQIPKKKADGFFTTAILPENIERNRVREVIPYEENRVELVPTKENNTGYINASHIKVMMGKTKWHYIATQGPLPQTCHDFWQMVWEEGVNIDLCFAWYYHYIECLWTQNSKESNLEQGRNKSC